jgi:hypothetical protein
MEAGKVRKRAPRRWLLPVRVLLVTFLITLLSFAISLFLGIIGLVILARVRGVPLDMTHAYRQFAAPTAAIVGAVALIATTVMEMRRQHQSKALAAIEEAAEKMSR